MRYILFFYNFIYNNIFIPLGIVLVKLMKPFNKKLKEREDNWEESFEKLNLLDKNRKTVWFHAASMGEFEQAKPIIERLKTEGTDINIVCSFYSPSGFNNQKDYDFADAVVYMPFDTKKNAKRFISKIAPDLAVFIRYDIWRNHLLELRKRDIPVWLADATKPNSMLATSNFLIGFTKSNYKLFDIIYTLTESDYKYFTSLNTGNRVVKSSDTRFDRIIEKVEEARKESVLPDDLFLEKDFILVAGSTWQDDENNLVAAYEKLESGDRNLRIIYVPHEPTEEHIKALKGKVKNHILYSELLDKFNTEYGKIAEESRHIIIDKIGLLLKLYSIADAAFIGGGFGSGVHSVTEPAGYSIPLSCGPKIENSPDAVNLSKIGALEVISNDKELYNWLRSIINYEDQRKKYGDLAGNYVYRSRGSSAIIAHDVKKTLGM